MLPLSKPASASLERVLREHPLGEGGRRYLASRGLLEVATDPSSGVVFGEVQTASRPEDSRYLGRLVVPTFSARGSIVHVTFRCTRDHVCEDHPKYLHYPGVDSRLYNTAALGRARDVVDITEGQLDAASLTAVGLHAVGVPGSQAWKPHAWRLFQGFDRVRFWADQDDKGSSLELYARIRLHLRTAELVRLPAGADVNSLLVSGGPEALLRLTDGDDGSHTGSTAEDAPPLNEGESTDDPIIHYDPAGQPIPF